MHFLHKFICKFPNLAENFQGRQCFDYYKLCLFCFFLLICFLSCALHTLSFSLSLSLKILVSVGLGYTSWLITVNHTLCSKVLEHFL